MAPRSTTSVALEPTSLVDQGTPPPRRSAHLFVAVFSTWVLALVWFLPRLASLLELGGGPAETLALLYFVVFTAVAWLYGLYNIGVVVFARIERQLSPPATLAVARPQTEVALLYTTCNDFLEASARSCVDLDYQNYHVYFLDDSSSPEHRARVDRFAAAHPSRVTVVRRPTRAGFKAGNLNHALEHVVTQSFFAVVDADEILPRNFLSRLVPLLQADPSRGFVQASHVCSPRPRGSLEGDMQLGIDVHWRWYQRLRNRFGFVMFLGHGAVIRRSCWSLVGGFPEIVSEDLGFAWALREQGYFGYFADDVVCEEAFPGSVRSFRIRHVKWTRGTCEFLHGWMSRILTARGVSWAEKLDVLFPTLNLPLTFLFFLFMIDVGIVLPLALGDERVMTFELGGWSFVHAFTFMPEAMTALFTVDFFAMTVLTLFAPVLCFVLELWRRPLRLFEFLSHSTALYAALSPLSAVAVVGYLVTRKARFLVTGDLAAPSRQSRAFFTETHPDDLRVRAVEVLAGLVLLAAALQGIQIGLLGLSIAFVNLTLMHSLGWNSRFARFFVWLPFPMILGSLALGGAGMLGMPTVLFGFGFHF